MNDEKIKQRASVILSEDAFKLSKQAQLNFLETIQNSEIYKIIKDDPVLLETFVINSASSLIDRILRATAIKYGGLDLRMLDGCLNQIRSGLIEHFNSEKEES